MALRSVLISWMKAAGEPSRLRLLALCSERDLAVTELARTLRQSGPRVSRHLKILCEAGLLERVRQGQWVHYRLPKDSAAARFVRGILAQLDRDDQILARDRRQARIAEPLVPAAAPSGARLGRALRSFLEVDRPANQARSALLIGLRHLELLEGAARGAARCAAAVPTRRAAQALRTFVEERGLVCSIQIAPTADSIEGDGTHDAVILEYSGGPAGALEPLIAAARRVIASDGHLWIFARYEALETARGRTDEHPLARLRRLLRRHGLTCHQLRPIEADGEHVLAVAAVPGPAATGEVLDQVRGIA